MDSDSNQVLQVDSSVVVEVASRILLWLTRRATVSVCNKYQVLQVDFAVSIDVSNLCKCWSDEQCQQSNHQCHRKNFVQHFHLRSALAYPYVWFTSKCLFSVERTRIHGVFSVERVEDMMRRN